MAARAARAEEEEAERKADEDQAKLMGLADLIEF